MQSQLSALVTQIATRDAVEDIIIHVLSNEISQLERAIHGGRGRVGIGLAERVKRHGQIMDSLQLKRQRVPGVELPNDTAFYRNLNLVRAVVKQRNPSVVAVALKHEDMICSLVTTAEFQPYIKAVVTNALRAIQEHWNARHAIVLQSEVHTSRSEYDALRHLLSFKYDCHSDMYKQFKVWSNPFNESDHLLAPCIASRYSYLKERELVYGHCHADSSADGIFCGLANLEVSIANQVEHYWDALEPDVQTGKSELVLVLSGDATGGWRGSAVTHGEVCIGSCGPQAEDSRS